MQPPFYASLVNHVILIWLGHYVARYVARFINPSCYKYSEIIFLIRKQSSSCLPWVSNSELSLRLVFILWTYVGGTRLILCLFWDGWALCYACLGSDISFYIVEINDLSLRWTNLTLRPKSFEDLSIAHQKLVLPLLAYSRMRAAHPGNLLPESLRTHPLGSKK